MSQISDTTRKIIDQMIDHGLKRGHAYTIEFAFYGDAAPLSRLGNHLMERGYKQDTSQTEKMLILTHPVILDYEHIEQSLSEMRTLSERFGVTFDGWSADVRQ
jgi:regulator of RNase E activity RraB